MDNSLITPTLFPSLQRSQPDASGPAPDKARELMNEFMTLLMQVSQLSGGSDSTSILLGISMLSSMDAMVEQLISQQIIRDDASGDAPEGAALGTAGGFVGEVAHINQFDAAVAVGGSGANADCGPTSLVMALHQLGLAVAGETPGIPAGEAINLARFSMAPNSGKDGVDAYGQRSNAEHSTFTNFSDLGRGAAAAGAKSTMITPSASSIIQALAQGASVIASGTFVGKYPLPWTGDRGPDNQTAPGYATGHLIEISGYDAASGLFTVHDPARTQPHQVSASALEQFMAGNAGAMALKR